MARRNQRDAILDAATRVISDQGLARTTLEAVAAEAGISKGGLLYHFPNKKEMIMQLIQRRGAMLARHREEVQATLPEGRAMALRSYMTARLLEPQPENVSLSKMVDVLEDDDLRECVTAMRQKEWQGLEDGVVNPELAAILILAIEGLWIMDLFKIPVFTGDFRERIVKTMMKMVEEA